jgi:hypothetical protein
MSVERFDITHERRMRQTASVNVRRERAADGDGVDAGLLFPNRPGLRFVRLPAVEFLDQCRPLNAGFDGHETLLAVESDHAFQESRIEMQIAGAKLLAAHRVPASGDANHTAGPPCQLDCLAQIAGRLHTKHLIDPRLVQLRLHIVEHDAFGLIFCSIDAHAGSERRQRNATGQPPCLREDVAAADL